MSAADREEPSDEALWEAFIEARMTHSQWTHRAHVRIGYLHLCRHPYPQALELVRSRIQRLNAIHGTPEAIDRGYHETMTCAFMQLIAAAAAEMRGADSQAFCDAHPELLDRRVLRKFYTRGRMLTLKAKAEFVAPDLQPLPEIPAEPGSSQQPAHDEPEGE